MNTNNRQQQNNNRRRGRNNNNNNSNRQQNNNRSGFDYQNQIDNRARGNAAQMLEKYKKLAQDAQFNGDRVNAEYHLQFADHYFRVLADFRGRQEARQEQQGERRPVTMRAMTIAMIATIGKMTTAPRIMIDRPIMMTSLHRGMTTQKTHPMRNLTTANRAIRAHAAQNAMSVLSALQITGMQIAARAAITAKTLTMPPLASTLPYCRLPLRYRPVKTMPPKSQRVSPVPAA